jgi:hypothetical protein
MKKTSPYRGRDEGFTVAEMSIAMGVLGLLGLVFFQVLNSGLVLFSKNTAVNVAHEEARQGINRLTRDIHAAISVPQLRHPVAQAGTDPAGTVYYTVSSTGSYQVATSGTRVRLDPFDSTPVNRTTPVAPVARWAAGVSFQNVAGGPNYVWKDQANDKLIMIKNDGIFTPEAGMRLIVPFFGLEENILKVTASLTSGHRNIFISADETTPQIPKAPSVSGLTTKGDTPYCVTFYTDRVMYIVQNGRYVQDPQGEFTPSGSDYVAAGSYVANSSGTHILSGGVYIPYTTGTMQRYNYVVSIAASSRFRYEGGELHIYKQRYTGTVYHWQDMGVVARHLSSPTPFYIPLNSKGGLDNKYVGVRLTARDPNSSNRGYLATAALLDTQIDYRSRIALYQ